MNRAQQRLFAIHAWGYALALCIRTLPAGPEQDALIACRQQPTLANARSALAVGQHRPWRPLIEAALVEIGLAAIEDILTGINNDTNG
jgi:hypothetical protein